MWKCRRSHFQLEGGGVKSLRTGGRRVLKNFRTGGVTDLGGGGTFAGGSVPHYMPCITKFDTYQQKNPEFCLILPFFRFFFFWFSLYFPDSNISRCSRVFQVCLGLAPVDSFKISNNIIGLSRCIKVIWAREWLPWITTVYFSIFMLNLVKQTSWQSSWSDVCASLPYRALLKWESGN